MTNAWLKEVSASATVARQPPSLNLARRLSTQGVGLTANPDRFTEAHARIFGRDRTAADGHSICYPVRHSVRRMPLVTRTTNIVVEADACCSRGFRVHQGESPNKSSKKWMLFWAPKALA